MADDKKPKIDLKARLNRAAAAGGGNIPPPSSSNSALAPPPSISQSGSGVPIPPPMSSPPGLPVGPPPPFGGLGGMGGQAPMIDPSNPLSAVAAPFRSRPPSAAPPPPRPQRIEMDESTVLEARKGGLKQGLIMAGIAGAVCIVLGYVAGGASARGEARDSSAKSAKDLAKEVATTKDQLKALADKLEEGRTALANHKFPDTLAHDLGGMNIAFSGENLAGRRFNAVSAATMSELTGFMVDVTSLNGRREQIAKFLTALQKPLTDQFATPPGQAQISQVVVVSSDQNGPEALLATLTTPVIGNAQSLNLPDTFAFADPRTGTGNSTLPRYKSGDISAKPAAIPLVPKTFERLCPSEKSGQAAQLASQLGAAITEIRGDQAASSDTMVQDSKPGLVDRAEKLATSLGKSGDS